MRIEGLFYSQNEKILFLLAGYTDNSDSVDYWVKMLTQYKDYITNLVKTDEVKTTYITQSTRYKYMRVFYCITEEVPEKAFVLDGDWTMMKWLKY